MKNGWITLPFLLLAIPAFAQRIDFESLPGVRPIGNTLIRNDSVEAVVRGMIARALNGDTEGSRLDISTPGYDESIELPEPAPELKQILDVLGVGNRLDVSVNPVRASFSLPASTLGIAVKKLEGNRFEVTAGWKIADLAARTDRLSVKVPKGLFDRDFRIDSIPIHLGLTRNSRPIELQIKLLLDLTDEGTRISITGYRTNLKSQEAPRFYLTLGKLSIDGEPLELEIGSNGQSIIAREESIRRQFQQATPEIIRSLRARLITAIHDNVLLMARKIEEQPPLRLTAFSDDFIRNAPLGGNLKVFLGGIQTDLMFNHLQYIDASRLFSAQIAARFCFDGSCLLGGSPVSPINSADLQSMAPTDNVGVVFYESVFQDLVHSEAVQNRIRRLYRASGPSPGVDIAPAGVKVRFNPRENAISAILNLEIDIARTVTSNSSFGDRLSRGLGDLIEDLFGSGSTVKIPIEIKIVIEKVAPIPEGGFAVTLRQILPFTSSGAYVPPANCPKGWCQSNLGSMTSLVKDSLLASVRAEFQKIVTSRIVIPVNQDMRVRDFSFSPKTVRITANKGLLISGLLKDEEGGKQ